MSAWVLAASAAAIVEQIGAYAGLACVLGLGVLALLYFSQAREVRRLREWAGREPERAAELAQRVQADPQRRVVAQPLQPTTPAAQQQQATAALYASVGATPPGAIAPAGQLARPAATPAAGLLPPPGGLAPPAFPGGPAPAPGLGAAAAGAAAAAAGAAAAPSAPAAPPGAAPTPGAPPTTPAPMPAPTPSPGLGGPATATATPAGQPAPASAAAARTAAAQRSASLSAYANGSAGQDTHESDAARPESLLSDDHDEDGLTTGRIAAYVGGGVAVVAVAVVLMLVLTGGEDTQQPNDFGDTPAQEDGAGAASGAGAQAGSGSTSSAGLTAAERRATKVAVLNGTTQTGLARNVGDKIEKARFTLGKVGNNADQQIPSTLITYTTGNEAAAQVVAKLVGVGAGSVRPADANATAAADADVVVTVGLDQSG